MTRLPTSLAFALCFAMATALCQIAHAWAMQPAQPVYADQMWGLDLG